MFGGWVRGRGVGAVSASGLLRPAHDPTGTQGELGTDVYLGTRVIGRWDGLRPWASNFAYSAYAGKPLNMTWAVFNHTMSYGCSTGTRELELGSRVTAFLCLENCVGDRMIWE